MALTPFWTHIRCQENRIQRIKPMRNVPNRPHYTEAREPLPRNVWVQLRSKHIWMECKHWNNAMNFIRITSIYPTKYCHSIVKWEPAALWMNPMAWKQHQRQAEGRPMMTESCNLQVELKGQKPTWRDVDVSGEIWQGLHRTKVTNFEDHSPATSSRLIPRAYHKEAQNEWEPVLCENCRLQHEINQEYQACKQLQSFSKNQVLSTASTKMFHKMMRKKTECRA